jgi:hypothetical protein
VGRQSRASAWAKFVVIFGCTTLVLVILGMHPLYASIGGLAIYALLVGALRE